MITHWCIMCSTIVFKRQSNVKILNKLFEQFVKMYPATYKIKNEATKKEINHKKIKKTSFLTIH